ncbi:MAG TPA: hypothetical protein VKA53_03210, partial [Thermoanaerobaculia bacterium]|nr:hypothetical protein [Thermoanaerobaculia bacterium]
MSTRKGEASDARARPGRLRRWVMRPVAWLLALVALSALGVSLLLQSSWASGQLRDFIQRRASTTLERKVSIDAVGFTLLPL